MVSDCSTAFVRTEEEWKETFGACFSDEGLSAGNEKSACRQRNEKKMVKIDAGVLRRQEELENR